jgi:hypothetical protein
MHRSIMGLHGGWFIRVRGMKRGTQLTSCKAAYLVDFK